MRTHIQTLLALALLSCSSGCSLLDFGEDPGKSWEARSFIFDWFRSSPEEDPENPGYDVDGNKIVSPEVAATYSFPDVHAGMAWIDGEHPRITPTINVELLEIKAPYIRWIVFAVGGGADECHGYVGKRITSIFEVTVGFMWARRVDEDDWVPGIQGTIIKF